MHPYVAALSAALRSAGDPDRAIAMRAYMKDRSAFFGVPAPERRSVQRALEQTLERPSDADIPAVVHELWELAEREHQYCAVDLLSARATKLEPSGLLGLVEELARQRSWWDTVDGLASVASKCLRARIGHQGFESLLEVTERWVEDSDFWVVRLSLLHQNGWKNATDADRLFRYALRHAADQEFFIRKAIGWALRDYAWTNPDAVEQFVSLHDEALSGLTKREALKNVKRTG